MSDVFEKAEELEEAIEWLARQYLDGGALPVMAACTKIGIDQNLPEEWLFSMVVSRVEEIEAVVSFICDELSKDSARWN
jgi:hypothetical protein